MKKSVYFVLSVCVVSTTQAQSCSTTNTVRTAPDYRYELVVGSGGSEVLDKATGLIWQRCSLGQSWNGTTCTGTASTHTWTDALAKAKALGNGYRLPNIKELLSLIERAACIRPTINRTFFPTSVDSRYTRYWSGSSYAETETMSEAHFYRRAWSVLFDDGSSSPGFKHHDFLVRAVRVSQ